MIGTAARFLLAVVLGCVLAALVTLEVIEQGEFAPVMLFGGALTFMLFAGVPALFAGTAALRLLRWLAVDRIEGTVIMMVGGAAVGAWLMTVTFTSLESLGAIVGGSIGLMQGLLLHRAPQS